MSTKGKVVLLGITFILGMGLEKSFASPPVVLLTIDDSNPSAVTITATGANSGADDSSQTADAGVDLLGFFNQNEPASGAPVNSTLEGGNTTISYNDFGGDSYSTSGGDVLDLNFFNFGPSESTPETFSTTQPAFTGSLTLDLSTADVSALPAAGTQGQILSGFSGSPGIVIGEWQVAAVPEPGTSSLLLLGSVAGFVFWRRRASRNTVRA